MIFAKLQDNISTSFFANFNIPEFYQNFTQEKFQF